MSDKHKLSICLPNNVGLNVLEEFKLLMDVEVEAAVCEHDRFRWDYLRKEVLSKYVGPNTDSAALRRSRAIEKWLGVEMRNQRTNLRLYGACPIGKTGKYHQATTQFRFGLDRSDWYWVSSDDLLEEAARIVRRVIGDEPDSLAVGNFSSGASTSLTREIGNVARKFTAQADVTDEAWDYIWPELLGYPTWIKTNPKVLDPNFVRGNILFTVPKTTLIDRVAAKEPDLNMWAQKRLGDQIRSALRRVGIDLNDQTRNQRLACKGSTDGSLATLDLSSASDSMTMALVSRLLPAGWFVELDALRSAHTLIDDNWHENAMFSSMGNGFTFELESLLFYSIARAVCTLGRVRGRVSVYGDDIIVPTEVAGLLKCVLGFCGFVVNPKKSHYLAEDPFRESCGAHWYAGDDVKPFYVRRPLDTQVELILFLNNFRKWIDVEPFSYMISSLVKETWWKWAKLVDRRVWGGRDTSSKERLVTPHAPSRVWTPRKQRLDRLEVELQSGMYLTALRNDCERTSDSSHWDKAKTGQEFTRELPDFVLRRKPLTYWEQVQNLPRW